MKTELRQSTNCRTAWNYQGMLQTTPGAVLYLQFVSMEFARSFQVGTGGNLAQFHS